MPKTKISEYSATANSNTDVASINIDEGCAPSGINNAIRAVMGHLKDFQQGTNGDPFNGPVNGTVGATTPSTGAFTTLSATGNVTLGDASTDTLNVGNGGLIKDASGNVGVGVTPSAWNTSYKAFQFVAGSIASVTSGEATYLHNAFINTSGNYAYINAAAAARYSQSGGVHYWFNATAWSGTGSPTITFTQAMTLDASSNLSVATTSTFSAYAKLHVQNGIVTATNSTDGGVYIGATTGGTEIGYLSIGRSYNLAASGDTVLSTSAAKPLIFGTNNTERARIDSSGNLLVGTTSFSNDGGGVALASGASGENIKSSATSTGAWGHYGFYNSNGRVGLISTNGTATTYATSSDYRLKHDIAPMTGALAKVSALKPVTYKWNTDNSDGEGFIAHELAAVVPQCVTGEKDAVDEEGNPVYQGIDTSFLVATLTAAIQEQQSIIQSLTARITALEGA